VALLVEGVLLTLNIGRVEIAGIDKNARSRFHKTFLAQICSLIFDSYVFPQHRIIIFTLMQRPTLHKEALVNLCNIFYERTPVYYTAVLITQSKVL